MVLSFFERQKLSADNYVHCLYILQYSGGVTMEIAKISGKKRPKGFYIILQEGKYNLVPHQEYLPEAIAFAETTSTVEGILMNIVCGNLVRTQFSTIPEELDKLSEFPVVQRSLELILSSPWAVQTIDSIGEQHEFR